jgi:hypothetical protein
MFKVQNTKPGSYALDLETSPKGKGRSISIPPGGYLDLDKYCSRSWISSNKALSRAISSGILRLVHNSEAQLPVHPVVQAVKASPVPVKHVDKKVPVLPVHVDPPEVIDLSIPDIKEQVKVPVEKTEKKAEEITVLEEDPVESMFSCSEDSLKDLLEKPRRRRGRPKKDKDLVEDPVNED